MLYELIPAGLAFALYVICIGTGLWTALRHRSQTLVIVIMIAGYLVPFLVDSAEPSIWSLMTYETLFSIAMLLLSYRFAYSVAYYFAFGMLHIPLLIGSFFSNGADERYALMTGILLQHAVLFALSVYHSAQRKTANRPVALFLSFGLTAAWLYGLFGEDLSYVYRTSLAVCALIYSATACWLILRKQTAAVYLAVATFGWFLWLVHVLEAGQLSAAIVLEGTLAFMLGVTLKSRLQQFTGAAAYAIGMCTVLAHPVRQIVSDETMGWLMLIGSLVGLYLFLKRLPDGLADGYRRRKNILLWINSVLFLVFLTQAVNVLTRPLSADMQHLLLSGVWVLYAIAVIITGVFGKRQKVRLAGVLFLVLTLLKIIFADLPDVSAAVRAILFIGLGGVGVAVSRLFYKRQE